MEVGLKLRAIEEARQRVAPHLVKTPVVTNARLDQEFGASFYFKCENLQLGGAFKARGAFNAVFSLTEEEAARGVVTHSSGNHAGALALAARARGIPAWIVMPNDVPTVKAANVEAAGARIVYCEPTLEAREGAARELLAEHGATLVHPYNDYRVMAGQGTVALELLEQAPPPDVILAPVSGGGLLSGIATAARAVSPKTRLIGVEPAGADDAARSFQAGRLVAGGTPRTLADGLRATLGDKTFPLIRQHVDEMVTVSEEGIVAAMRLLWDRLKLVIEPSAAVVFAAVMEGKTAVSGRRVSLVLTGGNVDLARLPWSK